MIWFIVALICFIFAMLFAGFAVQEQEIGFVIVFVLLVIIAIMLVVLGVLKYKMYF